MKLKSDRIETLKMLISSKELGSQDEVLAALAQEGYAVTQATLSRDFKQLKVAKAASMNGRYVYVLPNETMYKRVPTPRMASEMLRIPGYRSINFSGNMGVIRTRPGYASSIAYNIDNGHIDEILGTIAGDDTIFIVIKEGVTQDQVIKGLSTIVPGMEAEFRIRNFELGILNWCASRIVNCSILNYQNLILQFSIHNSSIQNRRRKPRTIQNSKLKIQNCQRQ